MDNNRTQGFHRELPQGFSLSPVIAHISLDPYPLYRPYHRAGKLPLLLWEAYETVSGDNLVIRKKKYCSH